MNFIPLEESDLTSEKAKESANIYRFFNQLYDRNKDETKTSYEDAGEIAKSISISLEECKEIFIKNILENVKIFKEKENEVSAFVNNLIPDLSKAENFGNSSQFKELIKAILKIMLIRLNFSKSENSQKYDVLTFGKVVDAYEHGKMTIDEVNNHLWKYDNKLDKMGSYPFDINNKNNPWNNRSW